MKIQTMLANDMFQGKHINGEKERAKYRALRHTMLYSDWVGGVHIHLFLEKNPGTWRSRVAEGLGMVRGLSSLLMAENNSLGWFC